MWIITGKETFFWSSYEKQLVSITHKNRYINLFSDVPTLDTLFYKEQWKTKYIINLVWE